VGRKVSVEIVERCERVIKLLEERGELTCAEVAGLLGISQMQAYYVLMLLVRQGKVRRWKRGGRLYYYSLAK